MIEYRKGYKYQLAKEYQIVVPWLIGKGAYNRFVSVDEFGTLICHKGYAWDGASGPVPNTRWNMRASLIHDALYQLLRNEELPQDMRDPADRLFQEICVEDGVPKPIAWSYYRALKSFGGRAASPKNVKKVYRAPKRRG